MSSRARRVTPSAGVSAFSWGRGGGLGYGHEPAPMPMPMEAPPAPEPMFADQAALDAHLAGLEREAFTKGFSQGERAGEEAAGQRGEAMLHRLTQTLDELTSLRAEMIRHTERQMVQLALAIARRIVQREVSLDPDLLMAMAHVALDRLGESAQVTVRLHPDDYAAAGAARVAEFTSSNVTVVADARLSRGGCRVESDMGLLDIGIDSQLQEVGRALLGVEDVAQADKALQGVAQPVHV